MVWEIHAEKNQVIVEDYKEDIREKCLSVVYPVNRSRIVETYSVPGPSRFQLKRPDFYTADSIYFL